MSSQYPTRSAQEEHVASNDYPHTRQEVEAMPEAHAAESGREDEGRIAQRVLDSGAGTTETRDDCNQCAAGGIGVVDHREAGVQPITASSISAGAGAGADDESGSVDEGQEEFECPYLAGKITDIPSDTNFTSRVSSEAAGDRSAEQPSKKRRKKIPSAATPYARAGRDIEARGKAGTSINADKLYVECPTREQEAESAAKQHARVATYDQQGSSHDHAPEIPAGATEADLHNPDTHPQESA